MTCLPWHISSTVSVLNANHYLIIDRDVSQGKCKYTSIVLGTDDIGRMKEAKIKKAWGSFKSDVISCCARAVDLGADSIFFFCACSAAILLLAPFSLFFTHLFPVAGHGYSITSPETGRVISGQFSVMFIGRTFLIVSQCCFLPQGEISLAAINTSRTK